MAGPLTTSETTPRTWLRRGPLASLREEIDQLFSSLAENGDGWFGARMVPTLDISETNDKVEARLDLPGIKAEDIDVQVSGNMLTVSGERKEEHEEKGRTFHRKERRCGSFSRSVTLPCEVKEDKVDAQYHDGILTISMPKSEQAKAQKIKVKAT